MRAWIGCIITATLLLGAAKAQQPSVEQVRQQLQQVQARLHQLESEHRRLVAERQRLIQLQRQLRSQLEQIVLQQRRLLQVERELHKRILQYRLLQYRRHTEQQRLSAIHIQQKKTTQPKTAAPKDGQKATQQKPAQPKLPQKPAQPKQPQKPPAKQPTAKQPPAQQPAAAKFTPPQLPPMPDPNTVVATVNGEPIRAGELMRATYDWYGAETVEDIILTRILEQEARKQKVSVKPEEIEARYKQQLQNAEANLPPGMSLEDFLRRNRFPPSRLYSRVRVQLLAEKLAEKRIKLDDFIEYSEIVIRIQGANPEEQEQNAPTAEAKAQEAYQKIGEGLDFAEAAKQYSEDPFTKDRGGKKGWQHKRFLTPDILQQLEKLKPGQVSPPFRTLAGYTIVRLERTGSQATGDDLQQIRQQAIMMELGEYVRELQSKAKITNTIVKPLTPEQMMGGPPRPGPRTPTGRPPQPPRSPQPPKEEQPQPEPKPEAKP
jgi:peptidyl-prolyl cis-trans isomerase C